MGYQSDSADSSGDAAVADLRGCPVRASWAFGRVVHGASVPSFVRLGARQDVCDLAVVARSMEANGGALAVGVQRSADGERGAVVLYLAREAPR